MVDKSIYLWWTWPNERSCCHGNYHILCLSCWFSFWRNETLQEWLIIEMCVMVRLATVNFLILFKNLDNKFCEFETQPILFISRLPAGANFRPITELPLNLGIVFSQSDHPALFLVSDINQSESCRLFLSRPVKYLSATRFDIFQQFYQKNGSFLQFPSILNDSLYLYHLPKVKF